MKAAAIKNIPLEGPGLLGGLLKRRGFATEEIDLQKGDPCPTSPDGYDLLLILGGPMNVYETSGYPFLKEEVGLIRSALDKGVKVLGLCLGAQLMAVAAGAEVKRSPEKEIGWMPVGLAEGAQTEGPFKGFPDGFYVFQWHGDMFEVPVGGKRLAHSEGCPNQAFEYQSGLGLQFHLEVEKREVAAWCDAYREELETELGPKGKERLLRDTKEHAGSAEKLCEALLDNFLES